MMWRFLPASWAHQLAPLGVHLAAEFSKNRDVAVWNPLNWHGLRFPNRLGLAGGVDKNGDSILDWQALGAGFLEIGTVTPLPQAPNPGRILDRDWESKNVWNKMGFPNAGASEVSFNLKAGSPDLRIPVLVNIGKNRWTPNEEALADYLDVVSSFPSAGAFVINVSSPNTPGLRALQGGDTLGPLCKAVVLAAGERPVLVKLSPDLQEKELKSAIERCLAAGVLGFVLTNTTTTRPAQCSFPQEGGLAGKDLQALSKRALKWAREEIPQDKDILLISVGGVLDYDQFVERLDMGANLVEVYSALIFNGPFFFRRMRKHWLDAQGHLNRH